MIRNSETKQVQCCDLSTRTQFLAKKHLHVVWGGHSHERGKMNNTLKTHNPGSLQMGEQSLDSDMMRENSDPWNKSSGGRGGGAALFGTLKPLLSAPPAVYQVVTHPALLLVPSVRKEATSIGVGNPESAPETDTKTKKKTTSQQ